MRSLETTSEKRRKLVGVDGAAELLGVSINTVYGWASQRKVPYRKVGRLLKFYEDELLAWIEERKVTAAEF